MTNRLRMAVSRPQQVRNDVTVNTLAASGGLAVGELTETTARKLSAVDGNENQKPMKNRSIGRIDITVAWIIAVAAWIVKRNQKPDLAAAMSRPGFSL